MSKKECPGKTAADVTQQLARARALRHEGLQRRSPKAVSLYENHWPIVNAMMRSSSKLFADVELLFLQREP